MPQQSTFTILNSIGTPDPDDWRQRLAQLVQHAYDHSPQGQEAKHFADVVFSQVVLAPTLKGVDFDGDFHGYIYDAVAFGALMGYALAKTWPTGIEGLGIWLERARELAGIDTTTFSAPAEA